MLNEILTNDVKSEDKFLRRKTVDFDFKKFTKKEITELISRMRRIMHRANGVGLSANQIGLDFKMFIAEVPDAQGGTKFYAVFNPKLEIVGDETAVYEEGCLSIPNQWGDVERASKVVISGLDRHGKPAKIKAWGLLARVFQHEVDHLNGKLFADKAKNIYVAKPENASERV
jgi:peptide deformylase